MSKVPGLGVLSTVVRDGRVREKYRYRVRELCVCGGGGGGGCAGSNLYDKQCKADKLAEVSPWQKGNSELLWTCNLSKLRQSQTKAPVIMRNGGITCKCHTLYSCLASLASDVNLEGLRNCQIHVCSQPSCTESFPLLRRPSRVSLTETDMSISNPTLQPIVVSLHDMQDAMYAMHAMLLETLSKECHILK